jgi:hypothetical protein
VGARAGSVDHECNDDPSTSITLEVEYILSKYEYSKKPSTGSDLKAREM